MIKFATKWAKCSLSQQTMYFQAPCVSHAKKMGRESTSFCFYAAFELARTVVTPVVIGWSLNGQAWVNIDQVNKLTCKRQRDTGSYLGACQTAEPGICPFHLTDRTLTILFCCCFADQTSWTRWNREVVEFEVAYFPYKMKLRVCVDINSKYAYKVSV